MLTINPEEEKTIGFVVEINGVGCDEMIGHVRFAFEGVEYGFPVSFSGDEILATIKPLNNILFSFKCFKLAQNKTIKTEKGKRSIILSLI